MHEEIVKYFKQVDPLLFNAFTTLKTLKRVEARKTSDYFFALCNAIISQQLSGRVADVIFDRFIGLFPDKKITPEAVGALSHEQLRATGMSNAKATYIADLAAHVVAKEIILKGLDQLSDEEVIAELTTIKGIGRWTAEMFLMFTLGREDIFSHGDLGLRNAIKKLYNLSDPTRDEIESITLKWSPYRTYACRILWASLDG